MSTAQDQKIRDAIEEYGFGWKVEELMQAAQPAIRLNAERTNMDSLPIGASRMGGLPDLPPGLAWPDFEGRPLEFLVQINFAETAAAARLDGLPESGWLVIFHDMNQTALNHRDLWHGTFFDADAGSLRRVALAEPGGRGLNLDGYDNNGDLPDGMDFFSCAVRPEPWTCLPDKDAFMWAGLEDGSDPLDDWVHLEVAFDDPHEPVHLLGGLPMPVQGDPRPSDDWFQLLQLSTDLRGPGWMWGDMGRMYFTTTAQGLAARDFAQVNGSWDCY